MYVDQRNGQYYIAGTRVSLDSVIWAFRRGESPETILEHFPAIGSLAKVYGAIAFTLERPAEIERYLESRQEAWDHARHNNPAEIVDKVARLRAPELR